MDQKLHCNDSMSDICGMKMENASVMMIENQKVPLKLKLNRVGIEKMRNINAKIHHVEA